jgi:hypothetical protein
MADQRASARGEEDDEDEDHSIWDFTEALSMVRGAEMNAKQGGFSGYTRDSQLKQFLTCLLCYSRFICTCCGGPQDECIEVYKRAPKESV